MPNGSLPLDIDLIHQAVAEAVERREGFDWLLADLFVQAIDMTDGSRKAVAAERRALMHYAKFKSVEAVRQYEQIARRFPPDSEARALTDVRFDLFRAIAQNTKTPEEAAAMLEAALEAGIDTGRLLRRWLRGEDPTDIGEIMERYKARLRKEWSDPELGDLRRVAAREVLAEYA